MQDGLFVWRCFFDKTIWESAFKKYFWFTGWDESIKGWLQPILIEAGCETSEKHLFHQDNTWELLQSSCNEEMLSCSDKTAAMAAFIRTSPGAAIVNEMVPSRLCHIQANAVVAASVYVVLKTFLSGPKCRPPTVITFTIATSLAWQNIYCFALWCKRIVLLQW